VELRPLSADGPQPNRQDRPLRAPVECTAGRRSREARRVSRSLCRLCLQRARPISLVYGQRPGVIGPSVALEFVHRDEHPGSDSTDVELPLCDQIIEGALTDRKHSSCLSTADKDPIVRIRKSSGGRFLLDVASLVHDCLRLRAHICCVQVREVGSRLSNEISSGKYSMPE
jgi:hypothetical protein